MKERCKVETKVAELIGRAMKTARHSNKAIGDIADCAAASDRGETSVTMEITVYDEVDQRHLIEPFFINAGAKEDFECVLRIMARIAMRDSGAAKDALKSLGLDDKVITAIIEDR